MSKFAANTKSTFLTSSRLGRSGEQALFGGMIMAMHNSEEGKPHRAFASITFPQEAMRINVRSNPKLIMPKMTSEGFSIPIPATFFENICSESYWDVNMKKFGVEGGLKMPQVISAAVSHKIMGPPGFYPPYIFRWRRLEDGTDYQLKQTVEANSIKTLSSMTLEQRKEHAELMKRDMVANLYALLAERDDLVGQVILSGEYIMIHGQNDNLYKIGITHLLRRLQELFDKHLLIINYIPKVEARAGQDLPDVRSSVLTFHGDLRKYADYFFDENREPGRDGMQKLLRDMDNVDIDDVFVTLPHQPTTLVDENAQDLLLEEAKLALENGEEIKSGNACLTITQNLNSSEHYLALARIQLAMIPSIDIGLRIGLLKVAIKVIDSLDMNTVPAHLSLNGLRGAAANLLAELEAEQRVNTGGLICNH
jgi:hypothetical protein